MTDGIKIVEMAMRADADALRMIGQNIANAEVTAYRRQVPLASFPQLVDSSVDAAAAVDSNLRGTQVASAMALDPRPGTLKSTGEPLHVALDGPGFFVLQSAGGLMLTRRGDFHVGEDGMLKAVSGETVMGANGPIHMGVGTPSIDLDGSVRLGNDLLDQLRVVQIGTENGLQYLGNGSYLAPADLGSESQVGVSVRQGFLETSNVTPVGEMVQMMEVMRHFEASQRFITGYDELLGKAISELGKVT